MIEALPPPALEALHFLDSGRFLNPPAPLHRAEWLIEPSLKRAKELAWAGATGEAEEEDLTYWAELREQRAAPLVRRRSVLPGGAETAHDVYRRQEASWKKLVGHPCKPTIPREYLDLAGDIVSDLKHITLHRAIAGISDDFWEQLFEVYQAGGWPCGWSGSHPRGKLVVFDPNPRV